jgi:hypothetical protein
MTNIENAMVTMKLKHVLWLIGGGAVTMAGTLVVTTWALWSFTMGNLQSDVSQIREAVTKAQDGNSQTLDYARSAEVKVKTELADLTAELKVTNANLAALTGSVTALDGSIKDVDVKLTASIFRQNDFERWVVTRLGQVGVGPANIEVPAEWTESEVEILRAIKGQGDPLAGWYKATLEQP